MAASREDIDRWLDKLYAADSTYSHMIVVCDTYDWDDFPVYVNLTDNVAEVLAKYERGAMQKVMEVYNRKLPRASQMAEHRAYHPTLPQEANPEQFAQLRALLDERPATPAEREQHFRKLVAAAFAPGMLSARKLADDFGVMQGSVNRWQRGQALPHPFMWPPIAAWITKAVAAKVPAEDSSSAVV